MNRFKVESERLDCDQTVVFPDLDQRIAQWPAKRSSRNLKYVAWLSNDAGRVTQSGCSKKVTMNIARLPEDGILEVMMFKIGNRVRHIGLARQEGV